MKSDSVGKLTSNMKVAWIACRSWFLAEMGEILPSNVKKCCCRYDLVIGCAVYVTVEVYLWAILSIVSIYTEFKLIENREIGAFLNYTKNSAYYVTTFGSASNISRAIICKFFLTYVYDVFMFLWKSARHSNTVEKGKIIDFLLIHRYTNCNQRIPRSGSCALLFVLCDSPNRNFRGLWYFPRQIKFKWNQKVKICGGIKVAWEKGYIHKKRVRFKSFGNFFFTFEEIQVQKKIFLIFVHFLTKNIYSVSFEILMSFGRI